MLGSRKEIEVYVPHSGSMMLIDRVLECGLEHIVTEVDIDSRLPCFRQNRVPAYLGLEMMAQSIAAWFGIRKGDPAQKPNIGYLLGTRKYESLIPFFETGITLRIHARQILFSDGLASFECLLNEQGKTQSEKYLVKANVNVYSVDDGQNA